MVELVQSEYARRIVQGFQEQVEGRGRKGSGEQDPAVEKFVGELVRYTGLSCEEVRANAREFLSQYSEHRITGIENPVFFARACFETLEALQVLKAANFDVPEAVSVGLVERHETNSFALVSDPPLLVYTSGMFDFAAHVAFLAAGPVLRMTNLCQGNDQLSPHELDSLRDVLLYHALSSDHFVSDSGRPLLIANRHRDPPTLRATASARRETSVFFRLFFQSREVIYEFFSLHESAHVTQEALALKARGIKVDLEIFCDGAAILCHVSRRLAFAKRYDEQPELTISKLIMPLAFLKFLALVEACKATPHAQKDLSRQLLAETLSSYPEYSERITAALSLLSSILEQKAGRSFGRDSARLWGRMERQLSAAMAALRPEIDAQRELPGVDIEALRDVLQSKYGP